MNHKHARAVIFDFDGTLAELNIDFNAMRDDVAALAADMGHAGPLPDGYLLEQVAALTPALGQDFSRRAAELIMERELRAAENGRLFPFTRPLLAGLSGHGLLVAVISRNCGQAIRTLLPEADALDAFLPRERAPRPKPHPDQVLAACAELGLAPGLALVVGDHPTDMQAARAAGCGPVGVLSGRTGPEELMAAGAQTVLPDAGELINMLGGWERSRAGA